GTGARSRGHPRQESGLERDIERDSERDIERYSEGNIERDYEGEGRPHCGYFFALNSNARLSEMWQAGAPARLRARRCLERTAAAWDSVRGYDSGIARPLRRLD